MLILPKTWRWSFHQPQNRCHHTTEAPPAAPTSTPGPRLNSYGALGQLCHPSKHEATEGFTRDSPYKIGLPCPCSKSWIGMLCTPSSPHGGKGWLRTTTAIGQATHRQILFCKTKASLSQRHFDWPKMPWNVWLSHLYCMTESFLSFSFVAGMQFSATLQKVIDD